MFCFILESLSSLPFIYFLFFLYVGIFFSILFYFIDLIYFIFLEAHTVYKVPIVYPWIKKKVNRTLSMLMLVCVVYFFLYSGGSTEAGVTPLKFTVLPCAYNWKKIYIDKFIIFLFYRYLHIFPWCSCCLFMF